MDVARTFPDLEFFQEPEVQEMMVNILCVYVRKQKSELGYKQGMHELLAVVLYCVLQDARRRVKEEREGGKEEDQPASDPPADGQKTERQQLRELARYFLDPQYAEHDAYTIYCRIMDIAGTVAIAFALVAFPIWHEHCSG